MSNKIEFSAHARDTFKSIQTQILNRWGAAMLAKFERKTLKTLNFTSESPFIYQAIENNDNVRKAVIHKNCSVFYEITDTEIHILFFWDNRQDPIL